MARPAMKFSVRAGDLAAALGLAAGLTPAPLAARIPALGAVRLAAGAGILTLGLCNGTTSIAMNITAEITTPGGAAVPAVKLADLVASFPPDAVIEIITDETVAAVTSGRSRFRLSTLPVDTLPTLTLAPETCRVTIPRADAIALFSRPLFAIRRASQYLGGVYLHVLDGCLAAAATDGNTLARIISSVGGWPQDSNCIVPTASAKAVGSLIAHHRDLPELTLRRSATLIEVTTSRSCLTSKLVDGTFPDYRRAIGAGSSNNSVSVARDELLAAFARIKAVTKPSAAVGLLWGPERDGLHLCAVDHDGAAQDVVATRDVRGKGRIAFRAQHGTDLLHALDGDTVVIDAGATANAPIWVTSGIPGLVVVQARCRWPEATPHHDEITNEHRNDANARRAVAVSAAG